MNVDRTEITRTVQSALSEDLGSGDLTASIIDQTAVASARLISRERAIFCGREWFNEVYNQLDPTIQTNWEVNDGETIRPDQMLCQVAGPARSLLSGERTALNFIQTLSGTASTTRTFVKAIEGTTTRILDTRKTLPGLRMAQKYAVSIGGGCNHRIGLFDGVLIKENHIQAAGSITRAVEIAARSATPGVLLEVEVENLTQLKEALSTSVNRILLDNFTRETLQQAVTLTQGKAELEASGNITLENVQSIARTGVDFISIGAITKHLQAIDFSLLF
ncbi:MAG: carboxylating nicotinate-nucleotide diphosphorylase [Arenicellales bacterium]|nr:carboxylating nicotinate-nucleotide diphosphorylase [Arenicellales bacterium]MDP7283405.1 carboxylating nicotinate-nucleotide diphosphorylase [Arenicellales bacterium]